MSVWLGRWSERAGGWPGPATAAGPTRPRPQAGGTIQEAEIEMVKDRVNQLPEATRNFEKIRLAAAAQSRRASVDLHLPRFPAAGRPPQRPRCRCSPFGPEELRRLTGNFLKAGHTATTARSTAAPTCTAPAAADHSYGLDMQAHQLPARARWTARTRA
ncbi:MAG: hypothetical protein WKG07_11675 [Hymenobacter sp.]